MKGFIRMLVLSIKQAKKSVSLCVSAHQVKYICNKYKQIKSTTSIQKTKRQRQQQQLKQ